MSEKHKLGYVDGSYVKRVGDKLIDITEEEHSRLKQENEASEIDADRERMEAMESSAKHLSNVFCWDKYKLTEDAKEAMQCLYDELDYYCGGK